MPRVLLVEDEPDQLEIRKLLLEAAGHEVQTATTAADAKRVLLETEPGFVIMDLRLPRAEDGRALIRDLRSMAPSVCILVLSGFTGDLTGQPEADLVDRLLAKPVRSEQLIRLISQLALLLVFIAPALASTYRFQVSEAAEVVAEVEMRSPGFDWSRPGREAALATLTVDGSAAQHVMLWAGETPYRYSVFLGRLAAGAHQLQVEAPSPVDIRNAHFREDHGPEVANMPVLFARANTIGKFTDVPLMAYCERLEEDGRPLLQYTVIFSNEDGGTSTRALMARWGRTTDIEYVYKVYLGPDGKALRATIQAKDHKEVEFRGRRDGSHPLLIPITDNNMVGDQGVSAIRYQLAPVVVDLANCSREQVMDDHPLAYRVMAQELEREDKLRPFGKVDGQKISDPRNYVYLEARVANRDSRIAAVVRLKGERRWRSSNLGRLDYAIERSGWVRTTIELPPGARLEHIAEIGFQCLVTPPDKDKQPYAVAGLCRVERVNKAFFLDAGYRPGASFWSLAGGVEIPTGEVLTWTFESK